MEQGQGGPAGGETPIGDAFEATLVGAPAPASAPAPGAEPPAPRAESPAPMATLPTPVPPAQAAPPAPAGPASTRRRFITYLLGFSVVSSLALIAAPVVAFLVPPKESSTGGGGKVTAGTTADIPPGTGKVVAMGSKPVIVVNTDQGVKAFSAICTHLGCIVAYDDQNSVIACPCHAGKFNPQTGAVISGPPPAPLPPVNVSVESDTIYLVASA